CSMARPPLRVSTFPSIDRSAPARARSKAALALRSSSTLEISRDRPEVSTTAGISIHNRVERRLLSNMAWALGRFQAIADAAQRGDLHVGRLQLLAQAVDDDFHRFHVDGLVVAVGEAIHDELLV